MTAAVLARNETLLGAAIASKRYDVLRSLTHPSFTYTGQHRAQQVRWTRGEWLRAIEATQTISFVHTTVNALLLKPTAVVSVEALWVGTSPGAEPQQALVMSDVWVQRDGRWQILHRHASVRAVHARLEAPPAPAALMLE